MRHLFLFLIITSIAGVLGCASISDSRKFVLLRHPLTNKTVECPGEVGTYYGTSAEMKVCVESYVKDGYQEIYSY
jgi:hypothetical protein